MFVGYTGRGFSITQTISQITVKEDSKMIAASAHTNHRGNFIEILYLIEGDTNYFIEGDFYPFEPFDIVFSNATEIHGIVHRASCTYNRIVINLFPEFFMINNIEELADKLNNKYPGEGNHISCSSALGKMLNIQLEQLRAYLSTTQISPDLINNTLVEILKLIGSQVYSKSGRYSNPLLRKILVYIRENAHSDIGLNSIAEEFHVNRTHLARIFKELTKCSVNRYITIMRLDHAEQFRRYSNMSRTDAARSVGFKNYSSYYRAYKKYYGTAPKKNDPLFDEGVRVDFNAND